MKFQLGRYITAVSSITANTCGDLRTLDYTENQC